MYKANRQILTAGRLIKKGQKLPKTPANDKLFDLGYLARAEVKTKKKPKKPTKTHEE